MDYGKPHGHWLNTTDSLWYQSRRVTTPPARFPRNCWGCKAATTVALGESATVLRPRPYDFVTLPSDLFFLSQQLEEQGTGNGAVLGEA